MSKADSVQPGSQGANVSDTLFQQTHMVLIALDCAGSFTALNPAAEQLFGHSQQELLGQPLTVVLDPFSHTKAALMLERTLAEGSVVDWELDHLQPDGGLTLIGYTTCCLRDGAGVIGGIGAVGIDLTSKLELTAQLAQTNQELEGALLSLEKANAQLKATQAQLVQSEKMRALGQLVAGVSHEVNNPAAFVASNLTQLATIVPALRELFAAYAPLKALADPKTLAAIREAETAAASDYVWQDLSDIVAESQEGVERIRQIVLALRNFSRLDEAQWKEADLNQGLESTLRIVLPLCKDRIEITTTLGELPRLLCNPSELNQVFLNLLTNAVQAIPGAGQIWVTTARTEHGVAVTIRDSGQGMDAATLARLGEPFFTTKPVGSGTGLGLAVSFGIVQRHNGQLRYSSEPGLGATAVLELPVG